MRVPFRPPRTRVHWAIGFAGLVSLLVACTLALPVAEARDGAEESYAIPKATFRLLPNAFS